MKTTRLSLIQMLAMLCAIGSALALPGHVQAQSSGMPSALGQAYGELFAVSQKDKRGLMFYVRGQQIGGSVVRVIGSDAVEIRNNAHSRIIIRLDQVDAVAIN